jgi:hypothetical protein
MTDKLIFQGTVVGVQPRVRLTRSFDQRSTQMLGYVLHLEGEIDGQADRFSIGVGPSHQAKHGFQVGTQVQGLCLPPRNPAEEPADYYQVSKLKVLARGDGEAEGMPPWTGLPPELDVYQERGYRRLATATYNRSCTGCIWGCRMAVVMIVDHWNPGKVRHRQEAFCYGPKSCPVYKPGPPRKVPGRQGMTFVEEDWIDEEATAHRDEDA